MLCVANLRKAYGTLVAVDDLSLEVQAGETFGLLGPNGAGKTTTLHLMVGALRPDAGSVRIGGPSDSNNGDGDPTHPAVRRRIGVAPQANALYEQLSAEENLHFFGKMYDLHGPPLKERVESALAFAGLVDRRRDLVRTFSGGMKRRLNLVCALIHDPQIILMDEPTAGVDPQSRNHLFDNIETLRAQGKTILYTTHYMEEAQRLCDRVAIMDHGKVLALDTVEGLIGRYGGQAVVEGELEHAPDPTLKFNGRVEGRHLRLETAQPFAEVARLNAAGVTFRTLRVDRPDLEAVFLALTGRRLRD